MDLSIPHPHFNKYIVLTCIHFNVNGNHFNPNGVDIRSLLSLYISHMFTYTYYFDVYRYLYSMIFLFVKSNLIKRKQQQKGENPIENYI